jgi:hypothetical protein
MESFASEAIAASAAGIFMLDGHDEIETLLERQRVLADFGDFTLQSEDLDEVLTEACRQVAEALGTRRAKVLEIQDDGRSLFLRAGVGWDAGVVGHVHLPMSERSSETYAIQIGEPVITADIRTEERFKLPEFLSREGVVALANVPSSCPVGARMASCRWTTQSRTSSPGRTSSSCAPTRASSAR